MLMFSRHLPVNLVLVALGVWRGVQDGQPQQEPSKAPTHRGKCQCDKQPEELVHGLRRGTALALGYEWKHTLQAISISFTGGQPSHKATQEGSQDPRHPMEVVHTTCVLDFEFGLKDGLETGHQS